MRFFREQVILAPSTELNQNLQVALIWCVCVYAARAAAAILTAH